MAPNFLPLHLWAGAGSGFNASSASGNQEETPWKAQITENKINLQVGNQPLLLDMIARIIRLLAFQQAHPARS
jgi:hypothetical protein